MPINIIAHRGFWVEPEEKNSKLAFQRAFENNFGIETDVRDYKGNLVISHDIPNGDDLMSFEDFLSLYKSYNCNTTLALNIKADGLALHILADLQKYGVKNYFCFDMSVPDMLHYINADLVTYSRQSDIENTTNLQNQVQGFWMDEMQNEWINETEILNLASANLSICVVSSELHKRNYSKQWSKIKNYLKNATRSKISLCTDFPTEAQNFFNI